MLFKYFIIKGLNLYFLSFILYFFLALPAIAQTDEKDKTDYWAVALDKLKVSSYGEAVNALNKFLEDNKNNALAYQKRAFAKRKLGNMQEAEADYTTAISQNANLTEAYLGRAQARLKLDNYEQAIEDFNQTLARQPNHVRAKDIFYNRGLAYLKIKKIKEATIDFRESLKLDAENAKAWVNLAIIYYTSGEVRKACMNWLRARDLGSKAAKQNAQRACQCCM